MGNYLGGCVMFNFFELFGLWTKRGSSVQGIEGLLAKVTPEVRQLLAQKQRPYAMRLFRRQTGATLHQALRVMVALQNEVGTKQA